MLFDSTTRCVPSLLSHRGFVQILGRSIYEICRVEVVLMHQEYSARENGAFTMRSVVVSDEEGNPSELVEEQQQRWRRHFTKVLNI